MPHASRIGLLLAVSGICAGGAVAGEDKLNGRTFALADGFTIEVAAGPPLVDRPIVVAFDDRGRLYVADSSGSNDPAAKQLADKPHKIVRLEDLDGDGRFDRRTVFADRMMFPEGVMWHDGSLYVAAPPSIWKLTDTNNDGVADRREEWFQGKTLTGCANDLHGPYLGPDGWIYWCKGAFAQQTYERPGKPPFVTKASHVFRCRPDGSGVEPVMTGGMDNPVDVAFTPAGERIVSATFLQHPAGGLRDGLIHAVYGGVYGKVHDVLDGHPRTGPDVMPVLAQLGPAAACGLARYESDAFGEPYRDNLFAASFNLHKVTRHVLEPAGATFKTRDEDFLVSPDLDFHPTDVFEDADGSLLVVDTGGWYKLCCPTSQFHRPEVLGAIYRVRKKGSPKVADPRGLKMKWETFNPETLASLLDDPRPAVRLRAVESLARVERVPDDEFLENKQRTDKIGALLRTALSASTPEARRNAVWAATRIDDPRARAVASAGVNDQDETVRLAALHSISLWRDRDALSRLARVLRGPSPPTRRAAAEALGRIGDKKAVPALLQAAAAPSDRFLEHAIIYALIEIADPAATVSGLASPHRRTRRAALVALDQMPGGGLKTETVAPLLASPDPALKETAAWVAGRHPEWGGALASFLRTRLDASDLSAADRDALERQLARFARDPAVQALLADRLRDASASAETRRTVLRAMAQSGVKDVPAAWIEGIAGAIAGDPALAREAVATARALPVAREKAGALSAALLKIADDPKVPAEARLEAVAAIPGGLAAVSPRTFMFLREQLNVNPSAADVLAKAKLTVAQLLDLTGSVETAGPLELGRLLDVFAQTSEVRVGRKLVGALRKSAVASALRSETLKPLLARFGPDVAREADPLYAKLDAGLAKQKARLEEILSSLPAGEVQRGRAVFHGAKGLCSACHAVGYVGGQVGPDLTRVGSIRTDRDLLESIVFPSASFVRSYEPSTVATKDGKVYNGLVRQDAADEIVLATGPKDVARIPRADVEEMRPSMISLMPAGIDQQLTLQDLADLVAFLKACR